MRYKPMTWQRIEDVLGEIYAVGARLTHATQEQDGLEVRGLAGRLAEMFDALSACVDELDDPYDTARWAAAVERAARTTERR